MSFDGSLATNPKVGCDVALFSSDLLPSSEIWAADKGRIFPMSLPSTSIESETYGGIVSWISLFRLWCPNTIKRPEETFIHGSLIKTVPSCGHLRPINNFLEWGLIGFTTWIENLNMMERVPARNLSGRRKEWRLKARPEKMSFESCKWHWYVVVRFT